MKHLSLLLLLAGFAVAPAAFAEDEHEKAQVKANGVAHQHAGRPVMVQTQRFTPRQNFSNQQVPRVNRFSNGGVPARVYQPNANVNINTNTDARVNANTDARARYWHNRGNWNQNRGNWDQNRENWNRSRWNGSQSAQWNASQNAQIEASRYRAGQNWDGNRINSIGQHHAWDRVRHERGWWRSRYNRFALFGGGYYYWDSGYWYPAYGYDPYFSTYTYDAPIYAYQDQDPGQVIANVQGALQQQGYYRGEVDGTYGPMTRRALLGFQRDNGLPQTGQIDESTLGALGLE